MGSCFSLCHFALLRCPLVADSVVTAALTAVHLYILYYFITTEKIMFCSFLYLSKKKSFYQLFENKVCIEALFLNVYVWFRH